MSLTTAPPRPLLRTGAVGLVVAVSGLLGAPVATAAEDGRPVIELDPPDVQIGLVAPEMEGGGAIFGGMGAAASAAVAAEGGGAAAAALSRAAAALPPDVASALGARPGLSGAAVAPEDFGVDVPYGSTLHLTIPAEVDATGAAFVLDVLAAGEDDLPRRYKTNPTASDQPLPVTPLGAGVFDIAVPAEVLDYGPAAELTVKGLTDAATGDPLEEPLWYALELTRADPATVNLSPSVAYVSLANCSLYSEELCPGPTVHPGRPLDIVVPPESLLTTLGFAQLDTASYMLLSMSDESFQYYDSEENPELVTVHGPASATLHLPADALPAPFIGLVYQGDPATGMSVSVLQFDVAQTPVNPGLHSDTGWVEEVREVSPGSTAAVAGGALLLVSGLVGVAAVRPGRRPPLGG